MVEIRIGQVIEIKRTIKVVEIDNEKKMIKITWQDKTGSDKEVWITYKKFVLL